MLKLLLPLSMIGLLAACSEPPVSAEGEDERPAEGEGEEPLPTEGEGEGGVEGEGEGGVEGEGEGVPGCVDNDDCADEADVCFQGACTPCKATSECDPGEVCDGSGDCVVEPAEGEGEGDVGGEGEGEGEGDVGGEGEGEGEGEGDVGGDCAPDTFDAACRGDVISFCDSETETVDALDCSELLDATCGAPACTGDCGDQTQCVQTAGGDCLGIGPLFDDDDTNDDFALLLLCAPGNTCLTTVDADVISETCVATTSACAAGEEDSCEGNTLRLCIGDETFTLGDPVAVDCASFGAGFTCVEDPVNGADCVAPTPTGPVELAEEASIVDDGFPYSRPEDDCTAGDGDDYFYNQWEIENLGNAPVEVTVFTSPPGAPTATCGDFRDTLLFLHANTFNDANPVGTCLEGNDDAAGAGNRCSELVVTVPANGVVTLVVTTFDPETELDYQLNATAAPGANITMTFLF